MPAQQVRGKTAIVTGAGSGLNFALAKLLVSKGCNVVLADLALRPEAQNFVDAHSHVSESEGRTVFQKTDVRSWKQLEAMFATAEKEFGGAEIVVAGAGVFEPAFSSFWVPPGSDASRDKPDSDRYAQIDINVTHPIRTTQLALSRSLSASSDAKSPRTVLIVSSTNGQQASFATPVYSATKHAINGFVRSLAKIEPTLGIRIAAVAPGIMRTPLYTENADKLQTIDMDKDSWSEPEEVAEVMLAMIERDSMGTKIGDYEQNDVSIRGGVVIEVTGGSVRIVEPYNDAGPLGPGALASNIGKLEDDVRAKLVKGWGEY